MNYCGIDLANKSSAICIENEKGKILTEKMIPTDADGFRVALSRRKPMVCIVEASPLAEWTARCVEALGHQAIIIDPRKAKAVICTKKKTDKLDARNLAKMGRTGWYTEVHRKSEAARLLRSQLKARKGLVDTANAQQARIRGILRAHGIKVGSISKDAFAGRIREIVREQLPALSEAIEALLASRIQALEAAKQLKKGIEKQSRQDAVCQRLMSVPGVGPLVSSTYVATVDDPTRFHKGFEVSAYLGLVPSISQSGEVEVKGAITKEGDRLLRWLLVEAAVTLMTQTKRDFALKRWGKKIAKKKGMGKARVAVARKLAVILHKLWISGETFDWERT